MELFSLILNLVQTCLWIAAITLWWQRYRTRTVRLEDETSGEKSRLRYKPAQLNIEREEKSVLSTHNYRVIGRRLDRAAGSHAG